MSNSPDELDQNSENPEQIPDKPELAPLQLPKKKVESVLQELEIMAMQKGSRNSLDISKFDKQQISKLLDILSENEKSAFVFHTKRIDAIKEIELKKN